ncbi:MAG: DUF2339 domain-containing protein [Chitinophagaceae bacterium]|nr:DUF2339 domain-containing protein [Chitinophagaceae bacterium]
MDKDQEIIEIKTIIEQLSDEVDSQREKLHLLKQRLFELEKDNTVSLKTMSQKEPESVTITEIGWGEKMNIENFIGLRLMHLVGIVILVIGIAIGVKYAVDNQLISEAARISLAYIAGIILCVLSFRLKKKYQLFSAILFSGAMASLYFTTYAALVYYQIIPFVVAFILMLLITIATVYAAIQYNREEIAILGMIGAYSIPFLISANSDEVYLFFAYILFINCGIAFLSFKRNWKSMILIAMLSTWVLYLGWAASKYDVAFRGQAELFLAAFYILFTIASLAYALFKNRQLHILEVQHFVFNNVLALVAGLLVFSEGKFDDRIIPVTGFACLYFMVLAIINKLILPKEILLFKYLTGMSVICLVSFAGIKWDGMMVTMSWIGIAVGLFAAGVWSKMAWLRLLSILLAGVTLVKLILFDRYSFSTVEKIVAYISIGSLLLILSFFYQKYRQRLTDEKS